MAEQDSSTRTIASVGAVLGLMALAVGLGIGLKVRTLAEFTAVSKVVSEKNDVELTKSVGELQQKNVELEAKLSELAAKIDAQAAAAATAAAAPATP